MDYLKPQHVKSFVSPFHNQIQAHNECFNQHNDIEAHADRESKCTVCFALSQQLYECENCSQATCKICIQQWCVEQNFQCPNCFYVLKDLQCEQKNQQPEQQFQEETCQFHQEKLNYYCLTCNKAICTDCAMLGETVSLFIFLTDKNFFSIKIIVLSD